MDQGPRHTGGLTALLLAALVAACGADGEPEQPTRGAAADLVAVPIVPPAGG